MTKDEVMKLESGDRVKDTRDNVLATVVSVNEDMLRIRYDDSLSSNYIYTATCGHLTKLKHYPDADEFARLAGLSEGQMMRAEREDAERRKENQ